MMACTEASDRPCAKECSTGLPHASAKRHMRRHSPRGAVVAGGDGLLSVGQEANNADPAGVRRHHAHALACMGGWPQMQMHAG